MRAEEITSIGFLNNNDRSVSLSIATRGNMQPVFVRIAKAELDAVGGAEGLNRNKQIAVNFYNKQGAGRS